MLELSRIDVDTPEGRKKLRALEREETRQKRRDQIIRNAESPAARAAANAANRAETRRIRAEQQARNDLAKSEAKKYSGCNRNSFRCPQARNMKIDTPPCCVHHIRTILAKVAQILDDLGCRWWIDYGTLLGQIRHGGLIPWDKDTDLGMLAEDRDKLLSAFPIFIRAGFFPTYVPPRKERFRTGDRVKVRLSRRNHTNCDIFLWNRRPDGMLDRSNYIGADLYKGREFPEEWVWPIKRADFDGIDVATVAEDLKLVEHRYGSGWKRAEKRKHPLEVRE